MRGVCFSPVPAVSVLSKLYQLLAAAVVGIAAGLACALLLESLDFVTRVHWHHPSLLFLLPFAGVISATIYARWGRQAELGASLIFSAIRQPSLRVPGRMAPLVLLAALFTHLCGGSSGRAGSAFQLGGSLAAAISRLLRLHTTQLPQMLACGVAAAFSAIFGSPCAGAIFAIEASSAGKHRFSLQPLLLCLLSAVIADRCIAVLGIKHSLFAVASLPESATVTQEVLLFVKTAVAAVAFGSAARLFVLFIEATRKLLNQTPVSWLRPAIGGAAVVGLAIILGDRSYLGLGVSASPLRPGDVCIASCFHPGGAGSLSWFWKLLFTALTAGSGFKGGEVTPLFFIGAALGNALANPLGLPASHLAALGSVSVFAAAARSPLACTIMAIEIFVPNNPGLFTGSFLIHTALCTLLASRCRGRHGIYRIITTFPEAFSGNSRESSR